MTTLHVGTFDTARLKDSLSPDITLVLDDDSWEEWGEGVNSATDPVSLDQHNEQHQALRSHPIHAQLRHADSLQLLIELAKIMDMEPGLLVPMAYHRQRGTLACITPDSDWSEPYYTVEDTQARRFLARSPGTRGNDEATDQQVWRDLHWQDYLYLAETEPNTDEDSING